MKTHLTPVLRGSAFSLLASIIFLLSGPGGYAQGGAQAGGENGGRQSPAVENECVRYLAKTRSPQYHRTIDMMKPNVIVGELGTEVLIPENAFVKEDGSPVTGEVVINFSEYYQKNELILSNLPTMSNGRVIESGGVIYLEALSNGEKLKLAQGKSVLVNFPGGAQEGMRLFTGKYDKDGAINWVPMSDSPERLTNPQPTRNTAREGVIPLVTEYGLAHPQTMKFSKKPDFDAKNYIYSMLEHHYDCRGVDRIYLEIMVDEKGHPTKVRTLTGKNACMRLAVEEIARTIPWDINDREGDRVYMEIQPEITGNSGNRDNYFSSMVGKDLSLANAEIEATMARYVEIDRARNFSQNAFKVTQMGLINCDRFLSENVPMVASTITLDREELSHHAKVFMVFDDINSVMEARPSARGEFRFGNVPSGRSVTIVAMAYEPGVGPYLSTQKVKVGEGNLANMRLQKTTESSLKQALASL